jgi:hypothetical protein
MTASEEELKDIHNSTVYFHKTAMRILNIKISNSAGLGEEAKNFTWNVVSYQGSTLTLEIDFDKPEFVSVFQFKDQL